MSHRMSKKLEQALRQFSGISYGRELSITIQALQGQFSRWENKEIDVFEHIMAHKLAPIGRWRRRNKARVAPLALNE